MLPFRAVRLLDRPIVDPSTPGAESVGTNLNGPSLIRVPDWVPNPLGRYYLYFAHHQGEFIRLAYADQLTGPWQVFVPGTLQLDQTPFPSHIASPEVHVDEANRRLVMYYHGCCVKGSQSKWGQPTCVAFSSDGLTFASRQDFLTASYLRVFQHGEWHYGIAHGGALFRSRRPFKSWEERRTSLDRSGRHWAALVTGDTAHFFYSRWGDRPEHLLWAPVELSGDWNEWRLTRRESLLLPEREWEGADLPLEVSLDGAVHRRANQLRDPALYQEDGRAYLLYAVAGEAGIALAELVPVS